MAGKIKAGNYTKLVTWKEEPMWLYNPEDYARRKARRKADPSIPPIESGPGFRTTLLDGTVLDFTYNTEEEALEGMTEFYSTENILKMLSDIVNGQEVI